jgi:hypothetical protein
MSRRVLAAVAFLGSSILLFLFAAMTQRGALTMAVTCAKNGWSCEEKARSLRLAGTYYFVLGIGALASEAVFGWLAHTAPGAAVLRCCSRGCFRVYRLFVAKTSDTGYKSSDTSDSELEGRPATEQRVFPGAPPALAAASALGASPRAALRMAGPADASGAALPRAVSTPASLRPNASWERYESPGSGA